MLSRSLLVLCVLLFASLLQADTGVGDTRDEVIRAHGNPTSHAQRGDREILMYPHGARVELIGGKVVDVKGTLPTAVVEPTPPETTPASAATTPNPATKPVTVPAPAPKATPKDQTVDSGSALDALGKHIEKMDTAWGERPKLPPQNTELNWPKLAVSLVLHFAITLLALRIAFKIEEMDALWSGVFAITGIDLLVYAVLEILGPVTDGISSGGAVEGGLGALVMVCTIQKFCFTKKLPYAIATAMGVKLIVQLCQMFLFVLLLNMLFG
jgi:hypothetical protein